MARKTHRSDDILWTVTAVDIEAVLSKKNARQKLIGMVKIYQVKIEIYRVAIKTYQVVIPSILEKYVIFHLVKC